MTIDKHQPTTNINQRQTTTNDKQQPTTNNDQRQTTPNQSLSDLDGKGEYDYQDDERIMIIQDGSIKDVPAEREAVWGKSFFSHHTALI